MLPAPLLPVFTLNCLDFFWRLNCIEQKDNGNEIQVSTEKGGTEDISSSLIQKHHASVLPGLFVLVKISCLGQMVSGL